MQFPEKLIPLVIANAIEEKAVPIYGDGQQVRDWIYVTDHCSAIDRVLREGRAGEIYNISASNERKNIDLVVDLLKLLGKNRSLIRFVGDRPAHDRRYALDSEKIRRELHWGPTYSYEEGLEASIKWYSEHTEWWKKLRNEDYFQYYHANYAEKFGTSTGATV